MSHLLPLRASGHPHDDPSREIPRPALQPDKYDTRWADSNRPTLSVSDFPRRVEGLGPGTDDAGRLSGP